MKAITLWEPYATLIAIGVKRIETRSWPCPPSLIGERVVIHAAARIPEEGFRIDGHPLTAEYVVRLPSGVPRSRADRAALLDLNNQKAHQLRPGHVVCTAVVAACLPMVNALGPAGDGSWPPPPAILLRGLDGKMWVSPDGADVEDQRPFGDFAPGRWAWMLDGIERLAVPVPAKGKQGVWTWEP